MYLGKSTTQNPAICIAYIINMSEDTNLVLSRTISHKYAQLSQLTSYLANFVALQAPNILCNS